MPGENGTATPGRPQPEQEAPGERPPFSAGTYELLALLVATIGMLGLCNNLLVLVLYYKFKRLRTPTNLFLVNISLSDLLVSVFGVSLTFMSCLRSRWVWDAAGCVWDGFSSSLFGGCGAAGPPCPAVPPRRLCRRSRPRARFPTNRPNRSIPPSQPSRARFPTNGPVPASQPLPDQPPRARFPTNRPVPPFSTAPSPLPNRPVPPFPLPAVPSRPVPLPKRRSRGAVRPGGLSRGGRGGVEPAVWG